VYTVRPNRLYKCFRFHTNTSQIWQATVAEALYQGSLTEGEGSVRLTSFKYYSLCYETSFLNEEVNCTDINGTSREPLLKGNAQYV
jgi:hypothetical protein